MKDEGASYLRSQISDLRSQVRDRTSLLLQPTAYSPQPFSALIGILAAAVLLAMGVAFAANDAENLDRYIGHELAKDGRASRAKADHLLPLSCPPFFLRDVYGQIIDPNVDPTVSRSVSTKQTCGECHDYAKVTRGYHFQMGKDELYPANKLGEPVPLSKSPGCYGKWLPLYQRELAPKQFDDPSAIDMTSYQWVAECGVCHPGGGPAEYDRGLKRYDEAMGADPGLAAMMDGDYYNARWNESGVVEADCLICHLEGYDYSTRAQQLKKLNYRWAATAAAGFGVVEGSVKDNEVPKVAYRKDIFGADGKVRLKIQRPSDRACQSCHEMSSIEKRGTAWHSHYAQDVHSERGVRCVDCHPGDIRHNFAKGN
ncbi:MAG: NapC/NirT family cytochrome c [Candidatus Hydrogenedentes bacterium]|nr:NapC/NirT family cytochrome c [Candidatus Hydrogenedentota bacterium]